MKMRHYTVPGRYYRDGQTYEAGEVVTIPEDEKPGVGWERYRGKKADVEEDAGKLPDGGQRPADKPI